MAQLKKEKKDSNKPKPIHLGKLLKHISKAPKIAYPKRDTKSN